MQPHDQSSGALPEQPSRSSSKRHLFLRKSQGVSETSAASQLPFAETFAKLGLVVTCSAKDRSEFS